MNIQSEISDKREAILRSTLELIKTNGFHDTPISMIVKNAGVAAGTIYHYFPSKDAIIMELQDQINKEMVAAMFDEANSNKGYKQQFFEGWVGLCRYFINNPSSLIFTEQFNCSPYAKIVSTKDNKDSLRKFNEFFQYGMDKGYLKKMEYLLIASAVFGCITATAKYYISGHFGFEETDLCKIANILWDGIRVRQAGE